MEQKYSQKCHEITGERYRARLDLLFNNVTSATFNCINYHKEDKFVVYTTSTNILLFCTNDTNLWNRCKNNDVQQMYTSFKSACCILKQMQISIYFSSFTL